MKNITSNIIISIVFFILGGYIFIEVYGMSNSIEISYDNSNTSIGASTAKEAIDYLYTNMKKYDFKITIGTGITSISYSLNNGESYKTVTSNTTIKVYNNVSVRYYATPSTGYTYAKNSESNYHTGVMSASGITFAPVGEVSEITLNVSSTQIHPTYKSDICNNNGSGCICYQIKNNISNFTYGSHTGCNFKSTSCYYTEKSGTFDCAKLHWSGTYWGELGNRNVYIGACSAVITCAT